MLDCMFRPEFAEQYPVFLVNREEVVRRLHLPDQADKRKKYSYAQIAGQWEEMSRAVREIRMLGETQLTEAQKEILALSRNFDVVRGWMLGSRIMLEDPAAMERMEFPAGSRHPDGMKNRSGPPFRARAPELFWPWLP